MSKTWHFSLLDSEASMFEEKSGLINTPATWPQETKPNSHVTTATISTNLEMTTVFEFYMTTYIVLLFAIKVNNKKSKHETQYQL